MEGEMLRLFTAEGFAFESSDTIQQCLSLCSSFGLEVSEFFQLWELFYLNSQLENNKVLNSHLDKFRVFLRGNQLKTPSKPRFEEPVRRTSSDATPRQVLSPATPFSQRTTKCSVQFVFNEHIGEESFAEAGDGEQTQELVLRKLKDIRRCRLEVLSCKPKAGCRYMMDQVESRFNEIERKIKKFAKAFSEYEARSPSQNVAYACQEKLLAVGRVCYDAEEGDSNVVLLEGSVEYSAGYRTRLELRNLSHFSIFPGQVLVVEGHNPSGHCLVAERIYYSIPPPPYSSLSYEGPAAKKQTTEQISTLTFQSGPSQSISILIASGPFSTSDNLSFEPLTELFSYARRKRPNLLFLMGPFIDADHPHVKHGSVDRLLAHVFQEEIRSRIEDYCEDLGEGARVILVPSTRDAFHDRVFPQPPLPASIFEDPSQQITLLANPSVFVLDEVVMGCCTTDILRHLSSEELSCTQPGISSDRMTRLAAHLIGQRSFYPLFPPAVGTNLDASLDPSALDLPCSPDIMILPSDLVPFVKSLRYSPGVRREDSENAEQFTALIVNPGRLAKGTMGGTFVEILVAPKTVGASAVDVAARTKVAFIRI